MNYDVLVTDCETKHGYAIAWSLQKKGLKVLCHFNKKNSPFFGSVYLRKRFVLNIRGKNGSAEFLQKLKDLQINVLIPVSNSFVKFVSDNRDTISPCSKIAIPNSESIEIAQNKRKTFELAEQLGIPAPKTLYQYDGDILKQTTFQYPVVVKYTDVNQTGVTYCNDFSELWKAVEGSLKDDPNSLPIIQEYVEGFGAGFYALYEKGKFLYSFVHRRIHELPITGGASTFAVSWTHPEVEKYGRKLLDHLNWHGIAMVEFKVKKDNTVSLMEINPKFWGSYELSEKCGLQFALNTYNLGCSEEIEPVKEYPKNVAFRWFFPDLLGRYHRFILKNRYKQSIEPTVVKPERIYTDIDFREPIILLFKVFDFLLRLFLKTPAPHSLIHRKE